MELGCVTVDKLLEELNPNICSSWVLGVASEGAWGPGGLTVVEALAVRVRREKSLFSALSHLGLILQL